MTELVDDRSLPVTITGYCWPWTVRPGEAVTFMTSTDEDGGSYDADLVRIVCADGLADPAMFDTRPLPAAFAGSYPARRQAIALGSYCEIEANPLLDGLGSFSVQAMVQPTLLPGGGEARSGGGALSAEPRIYREQYVIARWDAPTQAGWALLLDEHGHGAFQVGNGGRTMRVTLDLPLIQDQWFLMLASYDAEHNTVAIYAQFVTSKPGRAGWPRQQAEAHLADDLAPVQFGALRFAAAAGECGAAGRSIPHRCFNGRLDRVRLSRGLVDPDSAMALSVRALPEAHADLIGFWDFAIDIAGPGITDLSGNRLDGQAVNIPSRGVAGIEWSGQEADWRHAPDAFSAIHFHDDDLYDAEWASDFRYVVPCDLPSGIYAARLRHRGCVDHIPFFVAPPQGVATAPIALLIPTATYTAYSNIPTFTGFMKRPRAAAGPDGPLMIDEDLAAGIRQGKAHAEQLMRQWRAFGKGLYANHSDGTLCTIASGKHPNLTIRPNGIQWTLPADSLITAWLEATGHPYDILTDELLEAEGAELLARYAVVITGNHPEYYSGRMLDAIACFQGDGGRIMYLGANGFFWATSFSDHFPGAIEVRKDQSYAGHCRPHESRHAFDGTRGGQWKHAGRPPNLIMGVGLDELTGFAFEESAPYRRLPASLDPRVAFIFDGVDSEVIGDHGIMAGGAAGQELDSVSAEHGGAIDLFHLARADGFERQLAMARPDYAHCVPRPHGDLVYFETAKGGATFSVGSMAWVGSLCTNGYDNDVARITGNVLRRFLESSRPVERLSAPADASNP